MNADLLRKNFFLSEDIYSLKSVYERVFQKVLPKIIGNRQLIFFQLFFCLMVKQTIKLLLPKNLLSSKIVYDLHLFYHCRYFRSTLNFSLAKGISALYSSSIPKMKVVHNSITPWENQLNLCVQMNSKIAHAPFLFCSNNFSP